MVPNVPSNTKPDLRSCANCGASPEVPPNHVCPRKCHLWQATRHGEFLQRCAQGAVWAPSVLPIPEPLSLQGAVALKPSQREVNYFQPGAHTALSEPASCDFRAQR